MKKRIVVILLLLALLAALCGCGGQSALPQGLSLPAEEPEQVILPVEEAEPAEEAQEPAAEAEPEEPAALPAEENAGELPEEELYGVDEDIELPDEEEPAPAEPEEPAPQEPEEPESPAVTEDGEYSAPEDVALYLHTFGHLPGNFITKDEAKDLGWVSSQGNLWDVAPGKSIGGDRFGNYEGLLPKGNYRECDVNYTGGFRGSERIIYGTDGSIWYTNDHYESFTQLY